MQAIAAATVDGLLDLATAPGADATIQSFRDAAAPRRATAIVQAIVVLHHVEANRYPD